MKREVEKLMSKKHIKVVIDSNGKITYETFGTKGRECEELSKFLKALGEVEEDKKKDDFFKDPGKPVIHNKIR